MAVLEYIDGFYTYAKTLETNIRTPIHDHNFQWVTNYSTITLKQGWDPNNSNRCAKLIGDGVTEKYLYLNLNNIGSKTAHQYLTTGVRFAVDESATMFWRSPNREVMRISNGNDRWTLRSGTTGTRMRLYRTTTVDVGDGFTYSSFDCSGAGFNDPVGIAEPTYAEISMKASNSTDGFVEVRINGRIVHRYEGITCGSAETMYIVYFPTHADNLNLYIGDFYVQSGSDAKYLANNRGEFYIMRADMDADNNTLWTPSAGTRWAALDDHFSDSDMTYIYSDVVGDLQLLDTNVSSLTMPGNIRGVLTNVRARKVEAGNMNMKVMASRSASEGQANDIQLTTSYAVYKRAMSVDPITGLPWTKANLNDTDFGPEPGTGLVS